MEKQSKKQLNIHRTESPIGDAKLAIRDAKLAIGGSKSAIRDTKLNV